MAAERPHVRYAKLAKGEEETTNISGEEEETSGEEERTSPSPYRVRSTARDDLRYRFEVAKEVPWGSIALALFLLAVGTLFLIVAHLLHSQHMEGDAEQVWGFLVLGVLLFLPGFYETRIAYYSWRGAKGYRFSQIPAY